MAGDANNVVRFITAITSVIGVPIRGLLTTIGHSTVTAWLVLGICGILSTYVWSEYWQATVSPNYEAARRLNDARAREVELQNATKEGQSFAHQFSTVALNISADGVEITAPVIGDATTIEVAWKVTQDITAVDVPGAESPYLDVLRTGIWRGEITPENGLFSQSIPAAVFGTAWVPSYFLSITSVEQIHPGGERSRHIGYRPKLRIP